MGGVGMCVWEVGDMRRMVGRVCVGVCGCVWVCVGVCGCVCWCACVCVGVCERVCGCMARVIWVSEWMSTVGR